MQFSQLLREVATSTEIVSRQQSLLQHLKHLKLAHSFKAKWDLQLFNVLSKLLLGNSLELLDAAETVQLIREEYLHHPTEMALGARTICRLSHMNDATAFLRHQVRSSFSKHEDVPIMHFSRIYDVKVSQYNKSSLFASVLFTDTNRLVFDRMVRLVPALPAKQENAILLLPPLIRITVTFNTRLWPSDCYHILCPACLWSGAWVFRAATSNVSSSTLLGASKFEKPLESLVRSAANSEDADLFISDLQEDKKEQVELTQLREAPATARSLKSLDAVLDSKDTALWVPKIRLFIFNSIDTVHQFIIALACIMICTESCGLRERNRCR